MSLPQTIGFHGALAEAQWQHVLFVPLLYICVCIKLLRAGQYTFASVHEHYHVCLNLVYFPSAIIHEPLPLLIQSFIFLFHGPHIRICFCALYLKWAINFGKHPLETSLVKTQPACASLTIQIHRYFLAFVVWVIRFSMGLILIEQCLYVMKSFYRTHGSYI